jgi:uncharacterized membrane protein
MAKRVFLEALVQPNRPLKPWAIALVVGFAAAVSFVAGIMFALHGAWPVTPFFGLDVLLLVWAMRASVRASRRREYLRLTSDVLVIEHISATGRALREEINPYWLRVEHDDPELLGAELALVMHKRRWVVGSFLGAEERARLAEALRQALREARVALPLD